MTFAESYKILRLHILTIIAVTLLTMGTAVGVTYVLGQQYVASAVVQVRASRPGMNVPELTMISFLGSKDPFATIAESNSEMFKSRRVATFVATELDLKNLKINRNAFGRFKDWIKQTAKDAWTLSKYGFLKSTSKYRGVVDGVQGSLDAEPLKPTYLIKVSATTSDPKLSARIANAAVDGFMHFRLLDMKKDIKDTMKIVTGQVEKRKKQLEESEKALRDYSDAQKIANLPQEIALRIQTINQLEIAKAQTPELAKVNANALDKIMDRYIGDLASSPEKQMEVGRLTRDISSDLDNYTNVLRYKQTIEQSYDYRMGEVQLIDSAIPSIYPSKPIKVMYGGAGAFIGLLISGGYFLIRHRLSLIFAEDDPRSELEQELADQLIV